MENLSYSSFFFPSPNLIASISQDHLSINDTIDLSIPFYDHCFDEIMFPDSGFLANKGVDLFSELEVFNVQLQPTSNFNFQMGVSPLGTPYDNNLSSIGGGGLPVSECGEDDLRDNCCNGETSGTLTAKPRKDRSKTLVSERKRRSRMKDKLYLLRSLVPNITKMDKASIIADSTDYVKDMQEEAKKLAEEITELECSPNQEHVWLTLPQAASDAGHAGKTNSELRVLTVTSHKVGEGTFCVTIECGKGSYGVTSSLYIAIESLDFFHLEISDFSVAAERSVLTLTLRATVIQEEMRAATVKLLVIRALHKQGFNFESMTN